MKTKISTKELLTSIAVMLVCLPMHVNAQPPLDIGSFWHRWASSPTDRPDGFMYYMKEAHLAVDCNRWSNNNYITFGTLDHFGTKSSTWQVFNTCSVGAIKGEHTSYDWAWGYDKYDGQKDFLALRLGFVSLRGGEEASRGGSPYTYEQSNDYWIMSLLKNGNVGISATSPMAKLDIRGGDNSLGRDGVPVIAFQYNVVGGFRHFIKTRHNGYNGESNMNGIDFYLNSSDQPEASSAPGTANVHGMSITAVGVGISTTAPLAKFDVLGGSDNDGKNGAPMMAFQYRDGGYRHWIKTRHNGVANDNKNAIDFYLNNSTTKDASSAPDPNSGSVHGMSITATGVGIGTTAPDAKLHVEGGNIKVTNGDLRIRRYGSNGAEIAISNASANSRYPNAGWIGTVNNYGLYIGTNNLATNMYLDTDDNVFIGFDNGGAPAVPNAKSKFDLFVHQGILTEDYALAPQSSWSDYVFDKEYQLKKLSEVENFIQKNKRLPNIPSKEEIAKEGYSLHEVNVKLLEKIEELTLYAIEQEKEIKALKTQANNYSQQEERIKALEEKILNRAK